MRISFLDDEPEIFPNQYGGKARTIINLAKEFAKRPDVEEVTILSRSILDSRKEFYWNNIRFKKLENYSILRDIVDEASKTDVLNIHNCSFTMPLLNGFPCKTIYHLHDVIYATADAGSHLDKALGNNWSSIIAPSNFSANILKNISWWTDVAQKIEVVPRGIDRTIFQRISKHDALDFLATKDSDLAKRVAEAYPVIFFPHRFGAGKGEEFLEGVYEILSKSYKNPLILITDQIQNNNPKKLRNIGWIKTEELSNYYSLSDLCLVLSKLPETFSQTTLESVACQTPVIAFKYGNLTDLSRIFSLVNIAEPTVYSLIEVITSVLEDKDLSIKKQNSADIIDKNYNLESVAQKMVDIYTRASPNNVLTIPLQQQNIHKQRSKYFISPNVAIYDHKAYIVDTKHDIHIEQLSDQELTILRKLDTKTDSYMEKDLESLKYKNIIIRV